MMLGKYYNVVYLISSLASSIREKSFTIFSPLIMLALGIGIGLVAFSKAINYLLKNHREVTLFFIEGIEDIGAYNSRLQQEGAMEHPD